MISLYFGIDSLGSWLFFLSIILMVAAMIQFTIEIQIANSALDVHLSGLEKHQAWQNYLARTKMRGKNLAKPRHHLRRNKLLKTQRNQKAELFLIIFTLQIVNDRQCIFLSNIQSLPQIINFFLFITSNNTITES